MIETPYLEMQVEICGCCALQCKHCSSFPIRHIKDICYDFTCLTSFASHIYGKKCINITGGEPLHCNNLHNYLTLLKSVPDLSIGLFSSGIMLKDGVLQCVSKDYADFLFAEGISSVSLSIYHTTGDIHDKFTGVHGALQLTLASIENFLSAGIRVSIHVVINQYNLQCLDDIIADLDKLNLSEIRLLKIAKSGNAINNWNDIGVEKFVPNKAMRKIHHLNTSSSALSIAGFPDLVACRRFEGAIKCQAGINLLYITTSGLVFPCASFRNRPSHCVGSISDPASLCNHMATINSTYYEHCLAG